MLDSMMECGQVTCSAHCFILVQSSFQTNHLFISGTVFMLCYLCVPFCSAFRDFIYSINSFLWPWIWESIFFLCSSSGTARIIILVLGYFLNCMKEQFLVLFWCVIYCTSFFVCVFCLPGMCLFWHVIYHAISTNHDPLVLCSKTYISHSFNSKLSSPVRNDDFLTIVTMPYLLISLYLSTKAQLCLLFMNFTIA